MTRIFLFGGVAVALVACAKSQQPAAAAEPVAEGTDLYTQMAGGRRGQEVPGQVVPYVTTPEPVVAAMLELGRIGASDVIYDLGCGDGRMVIAAVGHTGAERGVGVEIVPEIAEEARGAVVAAGLEGRVEILTRDIFEVDLRNASVVMMYLLFTVNLRLRPHLIRDLAPGARVVSHTFSMGDAWPPDEVRAVTTDIEHKIYGWTVPAPVAGTWRATTSTTGDEVLIFTFEQTFQRVSGSRGEGEARLPIRDVSLHGEQLGFTVGDARIEATVEGEEMSGRVTAAEQAYAWQARRDPVQPIGRWAWEEEAVTVELAITDEGGARTARLIRDGASSEVADFYLWGASLLVNLGDVEHGRPSVTYSGSVRGNAIIGRRVEAGVAESWTARRRSE